MVCRWGGDEFIICMRDANLIDGQLKLERIQSELAITYDIQISFGTVEILTADHKLQKTIELAQTKLQKTRA